MTTLETNETTTGWTNKAGDQGHARRDLWVFFCFPFNWVLQIVLRERRPSHHYEPLFLSLVDRPAPLGSIPHSSHSHPIKNFHRLGLAITRAKPLFIFFFFLISCGLNLQQTTLQCSSARRRLFLMGAIKQNYIFRFLSHFNVSQMRMVYHCLPLDLYF